MLYALFLAIAFFYNWWKFNKNREALLSSLVEARTATHREMILSHHFYVFIFEGFLAFIVAHFMSEKSLDLGILSLGGIYLMLVFLGFFVYQYFVGYLEKFTQLSLKQSFQQYLIKELRVNFALVLLPILIYATINLTFQDNVYEEWGRLWLIGLLMNLIFVSVLTIACTVIIMLKLIPNREVSEPEYLKVINKRLEQIQMPGMRVRWIETDIKNAFVVGLKLLMFSNQTMFVGKSLRTMLSLEEFDAVICHELSHVANRHIHKRVIDLLKNFVSMIIGAGVIMITVIGLSLLFWGEDGTLHTKATAFWSVGFVLIWFFINYAFLFDSIRSHEYEADAYAVIKLGASVEAMKSALEKLSAPEDIPDYLKVRTKKENKSGLKKWFMKYFSTHPDLVSRFSLLDKKVKNNLPFNYYVSPAQRFKKYFAYLLNWKVATPISLAFVIVLAWSVIKFNQGKQMIAWIHQSSPEEIIKNPQVEENINASPLLIDQSLMFYIVKKEDQELIDHYIKRGANVGKTLIYLTQVQNYETFKKYYVEYQDKLSEDEYFLILRKSAQVNFTDGYRYLVNAKRFEDLNPEYKEDVSRINELKRRPASNK